MERLDNYFEKCIKDAYKTEDREYDSKKVKWFYIVVNNQILFSVDTPYERVTRRAENRIKNNVEKNFGFKVEGDYFIDTILQPNFACNCFTVDGSVFFLCKENRYDDMEKGEVIPSGRYEKLLKAYFNINADQLRQDADKPQSTYSLPYKMEWNKYREVYNKAFGKYPEVEIAYHSKTVILSEETFVKSEEPTMTSSYDLDIDEFSF